MRIVQRWQRKFSVIFAISVSARVCVYLWFPPPRHSRTRHRGRQNTQSKTPLSNGNLSNQTYRLQPGQVERDAPVGGKHGVHVPLAQHVLQACPASVRQNDSHGRSE